ncbi:MAG: pyridoxal phosphate-dependent aminotransferase [Bacteroidales bacterium]|nr:pyridoxal phosphate-dependent aminotransferase [Bacteroidales bacterium]
MPTISNRGSRMPSSPIRKLAPLAVAAKEKGVKIYHLNIGQPDLPTPQQALDRIKALDRTTLEYSPSQGFKSLRERLAGYYDRFGIHLSPDEIIVTTGGSEAVLFAFMACLNPGDQIIVPEPAYANYMAFAVSAGAVIKTVTSRIENGFALPSVEEIEAQITDRTKGILICNPNNPTGYLYTPQEMEDIRRIVLKHDLFLFSDEVYREFDFSDRPYVSAMHLKKLEKHVVLIDSVSKRYSECGIRIGAIVTRNRELRDIIMKFCQARLSPPLLGQIVAEASIDGTETYTQQVFEEYKSRRDFFMQELNAIPGVFSPIPQGAFYTVASLPVEDAEDFCRWCLTDFVYRDADTPQGCTGETVMMAPAAGFYSTPGMGQNQVRLAYVLCKEDLGRALLILRRALEVYRG